MAWLANLMAGGELGALRESVERYKQDKARLAGELVTAVQERKAAWQAHAEVMEINIELAKERDGLLADLEAAKKGLKALERRLDETHEDGKAARKKPLRRRVDYGAALRRINAAFERVTELEAHMLGLIAEGDEGSTNEALNKAAGGPRYGHGSCRLRRCPAGGAEWQPPAVPGADQPEAGA